MPKATMLKRLGPPWVPDDLLITAPRRYGWRVLTVLMVTFLSGIGSMLILNNASRDSGWRTVASGIIGLVVAIASMATAKRMQAYRSGWFEGRGQMVASLVEASQRGLSTQEWLRSQAEKDAALMFGVVWSPKSEEDNDA